MEQLNQDKAITYYEKHLNRLRHYNETHRDQIRSSVKQAYHRMKEDPEKWEAYKAKKRDYYAKQKKDKLPNSQN
jgi:hypothetical protein